MSGESGAASRMADIRSRSARGPPGPPTFAFMMRIPRRRISRAASPASPGVPVVTVMSVSSSVPAPPKWRQAETPPRRVNASRSAVSSAQSADPHAGPPRERNSAAIPVQSAASRPGSQFAAIESSPRAADCVSPL